MVPRCVCVRERGGVSVCVWMNVCITVCVCTCMTVRVCAWEKNGKREREKREEKERKGKVLWRLELVCLFILFFPRLERREWENGRRCGSRGCYDEFYKIEWRFLIFSFAFDFLVYRCLCVILVLKLKKYNNHIFSRHDSSQIYIYL